MITQELKQLVVNEALALRKHATKKERGRLDFSSIYPFYHRLSIYGQMTGSCYSKRAAELLKKCAMPYSGMIRHFKKPADSKEFNRIKCDLSTSFSPIEFYTVQEGEKTEDLIKLIKS